MIKWHSQGLKSGCLALVSIFLHSLERSIINEKYKDIVKRAKMFGIIPKGMLNNHFEVK